VFYNILKSYDKKENQDTSVRYNVFLSELLLCNINSPNYHLFLYGVYISQLIRYSRACGSYNDFLDRGLLLTRKLLNQRFLLVKLKSSLRKFYGRHHDLVDHYGISVS
jgi:hypothetical protein